MNRTEEEPTGNKTKTAFMKKKEGGTGTCIWVIKKPEGSDDWRSRVTGTAEGCDRAHEGPPGWVAKFSSLTWVLFAFRKSLIRCVWASALALYFTTKRLLKEMRPILNRILLCLLSGKRQKVEGQKQGDKEKAVSIIQAQNEGGSGGGER